MRTMRSRIGMQFQGGHFSKTLVKDVGAMSSLICISLCAQNGVQSLMKVTLAMHISFRKKMSSLGLQKRWNMHTDNWNSVSKIIP